MGRTQIGFPGNRGNVPFFVGGISNVHTYLAEERKIFILSPFVPTGMNLSGEWVQQGVHEGIHELLFVQMGGKVFGDNDFDVFCQQGGICQRKWTVQRER